MIAQLTTCKEVIFESGNGGGGSFWAGDNLLATLTIRGTAKRQGRLSIRDDNRALDLLQHSASNVHQIYLLLEGTSLLGRALVYTLERKSLFATGAKSRPVITFDPLPDSVEAIGIWNARQLTLHVTDRADLPLIGFYIFVAYDLRSIII
jgi:hypothetical protein